MKQRPLTPQQLEMLTQIFERNRGGETITAISKDLGIDRRTIYNWRSRPEWIEMEKELRRRLVEDAYESVMEGLAKNAMAARSPKWVELYLKATGKYKEVSEVQTRQEINVTNEVTPDIFEEIDKILTEN
ncbi:phBC6A51 family helix-turn-helix protein [Bacillus cereus]|nr:phBC6A51 family helix-turn-helix protein [Bacillus cereus]